jgi:hypothetical protein
VTSLNIRPDDTGLQSIKRTDSAASASPAPLSPSAPAAPVHGGGRQSQPAPAIERRRERRKGERRKRNLPVVLDTRSRGDRRRNGADADSGPTGVDIYV